MFMKNQTENNLVAKGNELIEGISDLELLDFKLLNLVISKIDSVNDNDLKTYVIGKKEIMEYLKLKKNYGKLEKIVKAIPYKKVIIHTARGEFMTSYWFHIVYSKSTVEFRIDPKLKPYLLMLSKDFTQYELTNTSKFKSKYSFKFYEWFLMKYNKNKLYKKEVKLVLSLDKIKNDLFLSDIYSKNFNHLKVRVIEPSLNDVNENTDLFVKYEKINKSRKIVALEFTIELKSENSMNGESKDVNLEHKEFETNKSAKEFFDKVWSLYPLKKRKADIKIKDMIKLQKLGYDVVKTCIDRYVEYLKEKEVEGFRQGIQSGLTFFTKGYIDYLDENYTSYKAKQQNINQNKPIQSTNFEQRKYDDEYFESLYENFK